MSINAARTIYSIPLSFGDTIPKQHKLLEIPSGKGEIWDAKKRIVQRINYRIVNPEGDN